MLATLLSPGNAPAEEALLRDGSRCAGTLRLEGESLHFQPNQRGAALSLADVRRIDFPTDSPPPCRLAAARRLHLPGGQQVSGELLGIGADRVAFRTGWASRLELLRAGVVLGPLPGWRLLAVSSFDDGLRAWTVRGRPAVTAIEKALYSHAVVLRNSDEQLSYTLAAGLAEGRVGINFREQDDPGGAAWLVEAVFGEKGETRRMRVTVAGPEEDYRVDAEAMSGTAQRVKRSPGWHRLTLRFSVTSLQLSCDDAVLWYNLENGPGLPLQRVELRCTAVKGARQAHGGVAWTGFCLERAIDEAPRPPTDPDQDEAWLDSGDQLFGKVLRADPRQLTMQGRFGTRTIPWRRLQGCSFRRAATAALPPGLHVRLHLHSGLSPDADLLDGRLHRLDERRMVLQHAVLGELTIERAWLRSLEPRR